MGKKLEANYDSGCKVCGEKWNKGDEICWDKINGKTITCTDIDCFSQQGGSLSFTKKAFGNPANIIITNVPEVRVEEDTNIRFKFARMGTKPFLQHFQVYQLPEVGQKRLSRIWSEICTFSERIKLL